MPRRRASRPLRSDARENRARLLAVAEEAFATEGFGIPIDDIARRADLGIGTLYRHFPTKQDLIAAVLLDRFATLADEAAAFAAGPAPEETFFTFFDRLATVLARKRDLGDALAGMDLMAATRDVRERLRVAVATLLQRAQDAGAVRTDVTSDDVFSLVRATLPNPGARSSPAVLAVVRDGLRPPVSPAPRRPARRR